HSGTVEQRRAAIPAPTQLAGRYVEGVEPSIAAADKSHAIRAGGSIPDRAAGGVFPLEQSIFRAEGIDNPIRRAENDPPFSHGRRVEDWAASFEGPTVPPRFGVHPMHYSAQRT